MTDEQVQEFLAAMSDTLQVALKCPIKTLRRSSEDNARYHQTTIEIAVRDNETLTVTFWRTIK